MAVLNALRTSGRLSVIVRTPPSRLVSTSATLELSQMAQCETPLLAWLHGAFLHLDAVGRGSARRLLAGCDHRRRAAVAFGGERAAPPGRRERRGDHAGRLHAHV